MRTHVRKRIQRIGWILFFLVIWEIIAKTGMVSELILPPLEDIIGAFFGDLIHGTLLLRIGVSLAVVAAGLVIGTLIAALLSILSYSSPLLASGVEALTSIAHPLPGIALLPLVILFFGTGTASILMIVIHAVLWPMVINFNAGFSSVKQTYIDLGRNYEYGRMGIIRHILIPSSWVYVVAGLRIAWARSWRAVISAEMVFGVIGAYGGLGWYIFNKRVFMDTPGMYAGLLVLIIIGLVIEDTAFDSLEKRVRHAAGGPR